MGCLDAAMSKTKIFRFDNVSLKKTVCLFVMCLSCLAIDLSSSIDRSYESGMTPLGSRETFSPPIDPHPSELGHEPALHFPACFEPFNEWSSRTHTPRPGGPEGRNINIHIHRHRHIHIHIRRIGRGDTFRARRQIPRPGNDRRPSFPTQRGMDPTALLPHRRNCVQYTLRVVWRSIPSDPRTLTTD